MRPLFYFILLFISLASQAQIDTLFPTQYDHGYRVKQFNYTFYLVDSNLNPINDSKYNKIRPFKWLDQTWYEVSDSTEPKNGGDGVGLLNSYGQVIVPLSNWGIGASSYFGENWIYIQARESLLGIMDTAGNIVLEPKYSDIRKVDDKVAKSLIKLVEEDEESVSVMKTNGEMLVEHILEGEVRYFSSDKFSITSGYDKFHLYDTFGNELIEPFYGWVSNETDKSWPQGWLRYCVYPSDQIKQNRRYKMPDLCGFLDSEFNVIVEPIIPLHTQDIKFDSYKKGWALIENDNDQFGFIDTNGTVVVATKYDKIEPFSNSYNGLAKVKDGWWGLIDTLGHEVVSPQYREIDNLAPWYGDLAIVLDQNWKRGLINSKGEIIYEPKYPIIENLNGIWKNWVLVGEYYNYGLIDTLGQIVLPVGYDEIGKIDSALGYTLILSKNHKYGKIDTLGNIVVPLKYDYIANNSDRLDGLFLVKKRGHYGFMDQNNNVVVEPKYKYIYERREDWGNKVVAQKKNGKLFWIYKTGEIKKFNKENDLLE